MTRLFIGVVSYEGSRFPVSQGPGGLGARLAGALDALGIETTLVIRTEDAHDESTYPLTTPMVRDSLRAKLRVERSWQEFLREGVGESAGARLRRRAALGYWTLHQEAVLTKPWRSRLDPSSAAVRSVRRLINIELSHVALLREAVRNRTDWVLVLEDDADTSDLADCASGLAGLMSVDGPLPDYVNVSQSHTYAELGIQPLLRQSPVTWLGSLPRKVLQSARPVTNTVCAILYRTPFAERLLDQFEAMPFEPVVPIDWKLNDALMSMYRADVLPDGSCWAVDPAPIDQLSMR